MTAIELIDKILNSDKNILPVNDYKDQYRQWSLLIHPDHCDDIRASSAFEKLTKYRDELEIGYKFSDELCDIVMKGNVLTFTGPKDDLQRSHDNFVEISTVMKDHPTFKYYVPKLMKFVGDDLIVDLWDKVDDKDHRGIRLDFTIEENHVRWILNRSLEFSSLLNLIGGWSHLGINSNSMLICPETHGIQIVSFYHSVKIGHPLRSLNGMIKSRYPIHIFDTKISDDRIDIELCKRFACELLGDPFGLGTKLKGSINPEFNTFLLSSNSIREGYLKYQDFLNKSPRTFHKLDR